MLDFVPRHQRKRAILSKLVEVAFACLLILAPSYRAQAQDAKSIDVFVTWLDGETVVLAFRSPAPSKRLVVGIARPKEMQDSAPSHLYQIPGLKEAIPTETDLNNFRAALTTAGTPVKYVLHSYPLEDGVNVSFEEIDSRFREYLHSDNNAPAELDVWDVKHASTEPAIRLVFLGDLVLTKPTKASNPVIKTENALMLLLTNLAMVEGKHFADLTLEGGCENGWNTLEAARRNPLVPETRKNLRLTRSGAIVFSPGTENEYKATNTGWSNRSIHLEFDPVPDFKFKVTSRVGSNPEEEMFGVNKDLELPPCAVAQISVQPLAWYEAFQDPIKFTSKDATLRAEVPDPGLRWNWILAGLVLLIAAGLLLYRIVTRRRRKSGLTAEQWKERMEKSRGVKFMTPVIISKDQLPPKKPWREFGEGGKTSEQPELNLKIEGKAPHPASSATASPQATTPTTTAPPTASTTLVARGLSSAKVFTDLLRRYKEVNLSQQELYVSQHELYLSLTDALNKSLEDLQRSQDANRAFESLRKERDGLAKSLRHWVETLKHLGDSPAAIKNNWRALDLRQQDLERRVIDIQALSAGFDKEDDRATIDVWRALDRLQKTVLILKKSKNDHENAALRIVDLLDPANIDVNMLDQPDLVATRVEQLRSFTDQVLKKFAEPLNMDNWESHSLTDLQNRFIALVESRDALAILGADMRVYRARIVSHALANAGRALREVDRENSQFASLFAGTNMEPATVAQQLLNAAHSSEATLNAELVKKEKPMNGQLPKAEDIDKVLIPFVEHLLNSNNAYTALMGMLRLWQVAEAYCRDSDDPLSAEFYERSQTFRDMCKQLLSDLEQLGVYFDPIRFLTDPEGQDWVFTEEAGYPLIRASSKLMNHIRRKLDMNYAAYKKTVADVNAWGFKCTLAPGLNRPTKLWLWRSDSKGSSEKYSL